MKNLDAQSIQKIRQTRGFMVDEGFVKPGSIGAEVGCADGKVSWYMFKFGKAKKIFMIDPWEVTTNEHVVGNSFFLFEDQIRAKYNEAHDRFADEIQDGKAVMFKGDGVDAAKTIEDESLDWVFIDDDHTYETSYANFEAFIPKVKPGGYIIGDDYRTVKWFKVIEAVADILKKYPLTKVGVYDKRNIVLRK